MRNHFCFRRKQTLGATKFYADHLRINYKCEKLFRHWFNFEKEICFAHLIVIVLIRSNSSDETIASWGTTFLSFKEFVYKKDLSSKIGLFHFIIQWIRLCMEMAVKLVLLSFHFVCNIIVLQGKNIAVNFCGLFLLGNCHCKSDIVSKRHLINSMYRSCWLTANIKQNDLAFTILYLNGNKPSH